MRTYIRPREPIYLIIAPCGCIRGYVRLGPGVLPHQLIIAERRRGNHVIESDLIEPPRIRACPHRTTGVQEPLPGLAPLVNKRKR